MSASAVSSRRSSTPSSAAAQEEGIDTWALLVPNLDLDVSPVVPTALEDFDMVAVVAGLDLSNVDRCLAVIECYRGPFIELATVAATRRKDVPAEFYTLVNAPLFTWRKKMLDEITALEEVASIEPLPRITLRRLRRQREHLTQLIVKFNYGLTRQYVQRFTSHTSRDDSADFQSAALLGLMHSIDTFDPEKGRFGSWAYKRIQREVLRAVRDADHPNLTHGDFERRPDVLKAYQKLGGRDGERTPTYTEVAAEAGVTVELVTRVLSAPHLESLHTKIGEDANAELGDLIPDTADPVDVQLMGAMDVQALMEFGLSALDPREHYVLVRRYGLDGEPEQRLSSIGAQLRLSREAIRQIEGKGLARLLHPVTLRRLVRHGRR